MKKHIAIFLLLFVAYTTAKAQDPNYSIELPVNQQPSSLVNIRLFRDKYGLIGQMQHFAVKITNLTNQKVRVSGTLSALLYCGNAVTAKFDYVIDPGASIGPAGDDLHSNTFGTVFKEDCNNPQVAPDPNNPQYKVYNRIRSVSIPDFGAAVYKDEGQTDNQGTPSNSNSDSYGSTSGNSSRHTAMNANDPRGSTDEQQTAQRQEQLNVLNEKLNEQTQKYNTVADAVKSLSNLLIGAMTQSFIKDDIKARNERFEELQNDLNTKHGTLADCDECNGEGYFTCTQCNGNGYTGDGDEKTVCSKCYGLGKTQCVHCRGTGKVFKVDYEYNANTSNNNNNNSSTDNTQQSNETTNTPTVSNNSINRDGYNSEAQNALAEGWKCSGQGNYSSAIIFFEQAENASRSCVNRKTELDYSNGAKLNLGFCYHKLGNDIKALSYYENISNEIDPNASTVVSGLAAIAGIYLSGGNNVPANIQKAIDYYSMAAKMGSRSAMKGLGDIYLKKGKVNTVYYTRALSWFTKAADPNYVYSGDHDYVIPEPGAMAAVGNMYENGFGVIKNLHTALSWYKKAFDFVQEKDGKVIINIQQNGGTRFAFSDDLKNSINEGIGRVEHKLSR